MCIRDSPSTENNQRKLEEKNRIGENEIEKEEFEKPEDTSDDSSTEIEREFERESEQEREEKKIELIKRHEVEIRTQDGQRIKTKIEDDGSKKIEIEGKNFKLKYELHNGKFEARAEGELPRGHGRRPAGAGDGVHGRPRARAHGARAADGLSLIHI